MVRFRKPKGPLQRTASGIRVTIGADERELLGRLLAELRSLILAGGDQPAVRRLFPVAYHRPEDQDAENEFQRLMHEELVASRLAGIDAVTTALAAPDATLTEEQALSFVAAVNQVRLVLGTVLEITEDDDAGDGIDADHPLVAEFHLYHYLSWMLDTSIDALA